MIPKIDTGFDDDEATPNSSCAHRDLSDFTDKVNLDLMTDEDGVTIRRSQSGEAFCRTGNETTLNCLLRRHHDEYRNFQGEDFCPVIGELQERVKKHLRPVRFVGGLNEAGEYFIYPQKLNTKRNSNSWNSSLAVALSQDPGVFIRLTSNTEQQRYDFSVVDRTCEIPLDIEDFQSQLLKALENDLIESADHSVYKKFVAAA